MASSRSSAGSKAQARTVRSSRSRGASTRARTRAVTGSTIRARIRRRRDLSSHRSPFAGRVARRGSGGPRRRRSRGLSRGRGGADRSHRRRRGQAGSGRRPDRPDAGPEVDSIPERAPRRQRLRALAEALALIHLANGTPAQRTAAAGSLGDLHSESAVAPLQRLATDGSASPAEREAAQHAIRGIERWGLLTRTVETVFQGASLG